jgi:hypothetical protein
MTYITSVRDADPSWGPTTGAALQPASPQRIQITATENIEYRFSGLMPKCKA